jgi:hypothetical protein
MRLVGRQTSERTPERRRRKPERDAKIHRDGSGRGQIGIGLHAHRPDPAPYDPHASPAPGATDSEEVVI